MDELLSPLSLVVGYLRLLSIWSGFAPCHIKSLLDSKPQVNQLDGQDIEPMIVLVLTRQPHQRFVASLLLVVPF